MNDHKNHHHCEDNCQNHDAHHSEKNRYFGNNENKKCSNCETCTSNNAKCECNCGCDSCHCEKLGKKISDTCCG